MNGVSRKIGWIVATRWMAIFFFFSCGSHTINQSKEAYTQFSPHFDADSAYHFIQTQVDFGPRVPNTDAHKRCGDYLVEKLTQFGASVTEQHADITFYDGSLVRLRNIIGSYFPEKEKRILLAAHWDSRPFADQENEEIKQQQPILGADDGASGTGILLEIARQLQQNPIDVGIDIVLFDLEDSGQPTFSKTHIDGNWWCMGSQYWSENPHQKDYKADFGILLDMVGAKDATFLYEGYSYQHAKSVLKKVWQIADELGFGTHFVKKSGSYITDDHVAINEVLRIPTIDIIHLKNNETGFAPHWHTLDDTMHVICRRTLKAVGQTVMEVIYREKSNKKQ